MITVSAASTPSSLGVKVYNDGFSQCHLESLKQLAQLANTHSIAAAHYTDGRRVGSGVHTGGSIIMIDCDKKGQADEVEKRISNYSYVKVPSQSNLKSPYKWHYFIPTQKPLSVFSAAYKYQIMAFFNQVGITTDMIDPSAVDIARQFAPAIIGMSIDEAMELSTWEDNDLFAPVAEAPIELCSQNIKSKWAKIKGITTDTLPANHVWFHGKAVTYEDAVEAIRANGDGFTSGFGCPNNNDTHSANYRAGYGFGYVSRDGDVIIKCSGDSCKANPHFALPSSKNKAQMVSNIVSKNTPVNVPDFVDAMEAKMQLYGTFVTDKFRFSFEQLGACFNTVINRNRERLPATMFVLPPATGTGKTTSAKLYVSMMPDDVSALIVVPKVEHAKEVCDSMNQYACRDIAKCSYAVNDEHLDHAMRVSPDEIQLHRIVVVTHERFRRDIKSSIQKLHFNGKQRDLVIVDEQINLIQSESVTEAEFRDMRLKYSDHLPKEGKEIFDRVYEIVDILVQGDKEIEMYRSIPDDFRMSKFVEPLIAILKSKDTRSYKLERPSGLNAKSRESNEFETRNNFADAIKRVASIFDYYEPYLSRSGKVWHLNGVRNLYSELGSLVVLDATSEINKKIELMKNWISIRNDKNNSGLQQDKRIIENIIVPNPRTYHNCQFFVCSDKWVKSSREGLEVKDEAKHLEVLKVYADCIRSEVSKEDKALVITYKDSKHILKNLISLNNVEFIHWGNHDATNEYRECNKVFFVGLNHKDSSVIFEEYGYAVGSVHIAHSCADNRKKESITLKNSKLAEDLVQGAFRSRARISSNEDGSPEPTQFYLFANRKPMIESVISMALEGMPNIQLLNWEIKESIAVPRSRTKADSHIDSIIEILDSYVVDGYIDVLRQTVEDRAGIKKDTMKKLLLNELFHQKLSDNDYIYIAGNGRKSHSIFTIKIQ